MPFKVDSVLKYSEEHPHVRSSLDIITKCLDSYDYNLDNFAVSFNGGKDCTVLVHLIYTVLVSSNRFNASDKLKTLYFEMQDCFPEIEDFMHQSVERYQLDLLTYAFDGSDWRNVLKQLKNSERGKDVKAIFMGTRSTDITYPLEAVQRTDADWPDFLRVSPILKWSYHDIWAFLRDLNVRYCPLYDKGYTSIGTRSTTSLNPKLQTVGPDGEVTYLPAYRLEDVNAERNGRSK